MEKTYLGDSVYADVDGDMIVLTTENGYGPNNTIYLEPMVFASLCDYVDAWQKELNKEEPAS